MSETVANIIASGLELHDIDQIFCVPGESYVGLSSILINRNAIKTVVCRHEAGAAFQFTQSYSGPGLTNQTIIQRTTVVESITDTTSTFTQ